MIDTSDRTSDLYHGSIVITLSVVATLVVGGLLGYITWFFREQKNDGSDRSKNKQMVALQQYQASAQRLAWARAQDFLRDNEIIAQKLQQRPMLIESSERDSSVPRPTSPVPVVQ